MHTSDTGTQAGSGCDFGSLFGSGVFCEPLLLPVVLELDIWEPRTVGGVKETCRAYYGERSERPNSATPQRRREIETKFLVFTMSTITKD